MLYAHSVNQELFDFYQLTRRTRNGVLDWLETLPPEVFTAERDDFAYGSLRAIFAHVADCYLWWVGAVGFGRTEADVQVSSVKDLRAAFLHVDATLQQALLDWSDWDEPFTYTSPQGWTDTFTRRWLILHPITHEFHHKGQALALARVLGHPHPGKPDTDLVTPGGGAISN
jgi:uncharacterized damage-inducible protein DinB